MRSTKSRPYRMHRRAELVEGTRLRITEAAVRLHTTIGPSNTTISNVAEEAGVTRLTVYRHFPDLEDLFVACRSHWMATHRPPDPAVWLAIDDLEVRARSALAALYGWYRENADDLFPINRDELSMPVGTRRARAQERRGLADALLAGHAGKDRPGRALRAIAGHLTGYWTWHSLEVDQGLAPDEAVDVAVRLLVAAATPVT
jgi:AcrR family transcriptional regulator